MHDAYHYSTNYYNFRCAVYNQFKNLTNRSARKFSPLFLVFGQYLNEIVEDCDYSLRVLRDYKNRIRYTNLNKIFCKLSMKMKEFTAVYVDVDKSANNKDYHTIRYASSNLKEMTGYRVQQLMG